MPLDLSLVANALRFDANETAFLNRQTEAVRSKVYEKRYLNFLSRRFIPTANDVPNWADTGVEVVYDQFGYAKVIANNASSKDLPRSDVIVSEGTFKIVSIGASYAYNQIDMRRAVALNVPLDVKKAAAARRSIEAACDSILFNGTLPAAGQLTLGLTGIANMSGVTSLTPNGLNGSWVGATADQITADLNQMVTSVSQQTHQTFETSTILLGERDYDIANTRYVNTFSTETILAAFKRNNPSVSVYKWYRLNTAGASSSARCIAYAQDPEVLEAVIPQEFEQFAPQVDGLEMVTPCHMRCGGVLLHQPKAVVYLDLDASSAS